MGAIEEDGVVIAVDGRGADVGAKDPISIGRDPSCDIVVDHPLISRQHAAVRRGPSGWIVEDQGSRNGIFVDGQRAATVAVAASGTVVHLGASDGPALEVRQNPLVGTGVVAGAGVAGPGAAGAATTGVGAAGGVLRIGRADDNTVVVADDLLVSRYHAEVRWADGATQIVDLASHNGTFVNGHRVSHAAITGRDIIGIGQGRFQLVGNRLEPSAVPNDISFAARGLVVRSPTGVVLLDNVDLAVQSKGLLAIVGPSGAGKTTLLNALTGVRPAEVGEVSFDGRDLYTEYDDLRRRIGYVPQDDVVHLQLTVRQALKYAAKLRFPPEVSRQERRHRVDEVMEELGLTGRANLQISRLSGGQRKRTSVAIELLTKPGLLFLDEPTSGLDPGYERTLMQLLRELADTGRTIIVVTHSVSSLHLCDRVLVMAPGGKPAYFGPPDDGPAYFGCEDYQRVFQILSEDTGVDWAARYRAAHHPPGPTSAGEREVPRPPKAGVGQFWTLTRRYAAVLRSDRTNLVLMAAQAPVLGLLQLLVLPRHELGPPATGTLRIFSSAAAILLNPVQIATALGLANAVRELVKERAIFRRERAAGLSIPAYLASKAVVLATIASAQALILVALTLISENGPHDALALGTPFVELTAVIALTGIAAMTLGLLVSAVSPTENMATTLLPVIIVIQNVLSLGGLSPGSLAKPVLNQAQYASSSQWGFAAAAATADLNRLQGLSAILKEAKAVNATTVADLVKTGGKTKISIRYQHTQKVWAEDMAALAVLALIGLLGAGLALTRLDPIPRPPTPAPESTRQ